MSKPQAEEPFLYPGFDDYDYDFISTYKIPVAYFKYLNFLTEELNDSQFLDEIEKTSELSDDEILDLILFRQILRGNYSIKDIEYIPLWDEMMERDFFVELMDKYNIKDSNEFKNRLIDSTVKTSVLLDLDEKRAKFLENDLDLLGTPEFEITNPKEDTFHFESPLEKEFPSVMIIFDQFQVSETFPVVWLPVAIQEDGTDQSLLKVHKPSNPEVG